MKQTPLRSVLGAVSALVVAIAVNFIAAWLIQNIGSEDVSQSHVSLPTDLSYQNRASVDGCVILFTLIVPSLAGGLAGGLIARENGTFAVAAAFMLVTLITFAHPLGLGHPLWRIAPVSAQAAHSASIRYLISNPLTALAFGTLGGWLGSQFATGQFTFGDRTPFVPKGLED